MYPYVQNWAGACDSASGLECSSGKWVPCILHIHLIRETILGVCVTTPSTSTAASTSTGTTAPAATTATCEEAGNACFANGAVTKEWRQFKKSCAICHKYQGEGGPVSELWQISKQNQFQFFKIFTTLFYWRLPIDMLFRKLRWRLANWWKWGDGVCWKWQLSLSHNYFT